MPRASKKSTNAATTSKKTIFKTELVKTINTEATESDSTKPTQRQKRNRKSIQIESDEDCFKTELVKTINTEATESDSTKPTQRQKRNRKSIQIESDEDCCKIIEQEPTSSEHEPLHFKEVWKNLREMRKEANAPVDTMGTDKCIDEGSSPKDKRFQALVSLMLSTQTKDKITFAAMQRLNEHGCSVDKILNMSDEQLGKLIYPVAFWRTKVKYLKKTAQTLKDEYDCDIPKTVKDLCKLTGVGPKIAHLTMKVAWDEITGIGVDTHVHRISNRLGWVLSRRPEYTREALEDWIPRELWGEVNPLLVGFGQQICKEVSPQCASCLNNEICPFGIKKLSTIKKEKAYTF